MQNPESALAIAAIAELDEGELGTQARELLDSGNLWRLLPEWAGELGESEIVSAAVLSERVFDDGRTVFLESRHPNGEQIAVGVYIDRNLGGMAKDVLLAGSIDEVAATLRAAEMDDVVEELELEAIEPGIAAGLINEAIEFTDMTWDPPVEEDYWPGRAVARLRVDQTPQAVVPEERPEMSEVARDALLDDFLASPEGAGVARDGDAAWVATLAIDFCADYVDGDPLRWSPAVVELFMTDWVPRKVMTTEAMLTDLPDALAAWVRFAAGRRGVPAAALAITVSAISECSEEMYERAADPGVGGPSKQLLLAASEAGVDLEDPSALNGWMAGWNARAELEDERDLAQPSGRPERAGSDGSSTVLEVKISLKGVMKPPVWRRLQLLTDTRLDELHSMIQIAFGWQDVHLHVFELGHRQFGPVDGERDADVADERRVTLGDLVGQVGDRIAYTYDFGDDWRHEIAVEKVLERTAGIAYPLLLVAKGAGPPEDCGGRWGYEDLKMASGVDPTAVDADGIRQRLSRLSDALSSTHRRAGPQA